VGEGRRKGAVLADRGKNKSDGEVEEGERKRGREKRNRRERREREVIN
jgi:hypothetical protein